MQRFPELHEIEPNLYLGSLMAAKNRELLQSLGIQCIVQVLDEIHTGSVYEDIDYYFVSLED